jgi:hypothetical protein
MEKPEKIGEGESVRNVAFIGTTSIFLDAFIVTLESE